MHFEEITVSNDKAWKWSSGVLRQGRKRAPAVRKWTGLILKTSSFDGIRCISMKFFISEAAEFSLMLGDQAPKNQD